MEINYLTRGKRQILQIDDARITYKNFAGAPGIYNREGDRNFVVIIDDEDIANQLIEEGWNVKIKEPREEGERPFMFLPVKVVFREDRHRDPSAYLVSGGSAPKKLNSETIRILDNIDIVSVDMDLRGHDWDINGRSGRTAYLEAIHVTQKVDRFEARYMDNEDIAE